MDSEQFFTLQKLCFKLSDRNCLISEHRLNDKRYEAIISEFGLSQTPVRNRELNKRLDEIDKEIGIGEKAEKMTERLKKQFAGVIDDKYFNHFSLRIIVEAISTGKATTLEEAEKIVDREMKKQHIDGTKFLM